jgi:hypothetical protein
MESTVSVGATDMQQTHISHSHVADRIFSPLVDIVHAFIEIYRIR